MLQLWAIRLLDNFFPHFNRKTSFMVRMDNLSAATTSNLHRFCLGGVAAFMGFIQRRFGLP